MRMYEVRTYFDPFLGFDVIYTCWVPGRAPVVPKYIDKSRAYRPTQQRARDGTHVRHRTGGLKKVS
jgi:hypothetical protein